MERTLGAIPRGRRETTGEEATDMIKSKKNRRGGEVREGHTSQSAEEEESR